MFSAYVLLIGRKKNNIEILAGSASFYCSDLSANYKMPIYNKQIKHC